MNFFSGLIFTNRKYKKEKKGEKQFGILLQRERNISTEMNLNKLQITEK